MIFNPIAKEKTLLFRPTDNGLPEGRPRKWDRNRIQKGDFA